MKRIILNSETALLHAVWELAPWLLERNPSQYVAEWTRHNGKLTGVRISYDDRENWHSLDVAVRAIMKSAAPEGTWNGCVHAGADGVLGVTLTRQAVAAKGNR